MTGARKSTKELTTLYKNVMSILRKSGVGMILCYGSLLGYHREHNFIEGDDDIDVMVSRSDFHKLVGFLNKATFTPVNRKFYNCSGITFKFWNYTPFKVWHETSLLQVYYRGTGPVDIYAYDLIDDNIVLKSCFNHAFPKSAILPAIPIVLHDFRVFVPADVEQTVILSYGKDWRIPKVKNEDYVWEEIPEVILLKNV
mgnify:CR=1 FL=1|jgi:phosphorylcholine metabolism protein LicD